MEDDARTPCEFLAAHGSQTYLLLLAAEREYQWLLRKLGCDEWTVDLRAFQMTRQLAEHCRYLDELWQSANDEAQQPARQTNG